MRLWHRVPSIAVGIAMLLIGSTAGAEEDWEHIETTDGVWVYERETDDGMEFRGVTEVDLHIGELLAVHSDPAQRPHWVGRYGDHESIEHDASSEVYWLKIDMPFGVTDRDFVVQSNYSFDEDSRVVEAVLESTEDDRKPEQDCCVRAETRTEYRFQAEPGEETTTIEVVVQTDPKGNIPDRIVESTQREWPVDTLTALIERTSAVDVEPDSRVADWHDP